MLGALLLAALESPGGSHAQEGAAGGSGATASPELRRNDDLQPLMDYTAREIDRMRAQMAKGDMTAEAQRSMAFEMRALSWILDRMAGLLARPSMKAPERAKELQKLREELEAMERTHDAPAESETLGEGGR